MSMDASKMNGNVDESIEDDEEDPVVHEIPVFLSKTLSQNLYLFQYPVRPANMPYDNSTVLASKVRPKGQQVELTLSLDTNCPNYDSSKGEQIALNVDGSSQLKSGKGGKGNKVDYEDIDSKIFPSGVMDKQVLSSTKSLPDTEGRYAIGILGGNELHVTPLSGILSLRPDLTYLDKGDKTAKAEGRLPGGDERSDDVDESLSGGGDDEMKQVTVRFAKSDQDAAKKTREKSYEYQKKKAEEEPWIQTRFHNLNSAQWEEQSQSLFCKKMDEEITSLNLKPRKYLEALTKSSQ